MPQEIPYGLSSAEVAERIAAGEINVDAGVKTRSIKQIFYENIFTLFNAVNVILALFVLFTGSFKNMLFMVVIICNVIIGIVQEIRSKRTTDKLAVVASSHATAIRDGKRVELPLDQLVRGDVVELGRGDQIPADATVVNGTCDVNESLLTGESNLIKKAPGDTLMSGSFVNAGTVLARVEHVGAENYAAKITAEAKQHKAINSEIMTTLNGIIKFVSCIIFPLGAILFAREFFISGTELNSAILSTVSAMVGMIPEGLILLTSTVLAVAVVRLAQSKVLVQQLYCIETLARVDTLCLDKTGTITTGGMEVASIEVVPGNNIAEAELAFASIAAADEDPNETACAILAYFNLKSAKEAAQPTSSQAANKVNPLSAIRTIPFSSDKKWSGAVFEGNRAYVMGAGQFILKDSFSQIQAQQNALAQNARVLLLAKVESFDEDGNIVGQPQPLGFVAIHDQIRSTAAQTIAYFKEQGVTVKVISGDDPQTVSGIAAKVGVDHAEMFIDASTLETDEDIAEAISKYSVFGRVRPEQKRSFVLALQKEGHVVAMTGDGVNDTLALKASDCSVAMASGSDAARNVAQLVLVDNDFASMPKVVAEGRRSINNLQRSASLFLVKTLLSISLAAFFVFLPWQYPFQPIQMTLISAFTIGLPSFVLALEPNHERIRGRFLENVIVKSIPGAICAVTAILVTNAVSYMTLGLSYEQTSTLCVLLTAWTGFLLVFRLCIPFNPIRIALLVVIAAGTVLGATLLGNLFCIEPFTQDMTFVFIVAAAAIAVVYQVLFNICVSWHAKRLAAQEATN